MCFLFLLHFLSLFTLTVTPQKTSAHQANVDLNIATSVTTSKHQPQYLSSPGKPKNKSKKSSGTSPKPKQNIGAKRWGTTVWVASQQQHLEVWFPAEKEHGVTVQWRAGTCVCVCVCQIISTLLSGNRNHIWLKWELLHGVARSYHRTVVTVSV